MRKTGDIGCVVAEDDAETLASWLLWHMGPLFILSYNKPSESREKLDQGVSACIEPFYMKISKTAKSGVNIKRRLSSKFMPIASRDYSSNIHHNHVL